MGSLNGVHHLAFSTADARGQIAFFSEVLGAELKAAYWMHGAERTFHVFLRLSDSSYVAFVQDADHELPQGQPGVSHADNYATMSAAGTMQHVAFNVADDGELLALRDRIRLAGYNVFGPINHGFCRSIYFAGPEGLLLEAATSDEAIDERSWIDPEVIDQLGITPEELARLTRPDPNPDRGGSVPQPPIDPAQPHLTMAADAYTWLMTAPDDEVARSLSEPDPPVKPA